MCTVIDMRLSNLAKIAILAVSLPTKVTARLTNATCAEAEMPGKPLVASQKMQDAGVSRSWECDGINQYGQCKLSSRG